MIQPTTEAWQPLLERKLPALAHLIVWGVYATMVFYGNFARMAPMVFCVHYGLAFAMHAGSFYLNYHYLVPQTLPQKSLARFLTVNLMAALLMASVAGGLEDLLLPGETFFKRIQQGQLLPLLTKVSNYAVFALLGLAVRLLVDWQKKLRKDKEKENEHLKSELAVLKGQINPHFLFNSLNNLYALSLRQAAETPAVILRISEMMRYLLYETNAELVPLAKEIEMLRMYVAMHEMGGKSEERVQFQTSGEIEGILIQPLLLLPLVENVFKHGSLPMLITVSIKGGLLEIHTENGFRAAGPELSGGVGVANLRRRLALLYPLAHQLSLQDNQHSFVADLSIHLSKSGHD
ncbi:Histidine kinase [Dyadobacter soli]|uniref:Histidine kinase n=1 Tax=Dyadobacter soli TaxID=659014 RepID=A0A1G7MKV3_9BACT|nr:sensor histidine kinase [Dyadobacter soli]SDF62372.1 Histidine kinase [Dyadobacter soli]